MPSGGHNAIPEADLIDALRQLADELGRSPSQTDINKHSPHSHKTYYRKFDGGLAEAKERAGLEHYTAPADVELVEVECANCGAELERKPWDVQNREHLYCSRSCFYDDYSDRIVGVQNHQWNSREVECVTCGAVFYQTKYWIEKRDNLFCSRECYGKWRSENVVREHHPRWKEYPELNCEWCGKVFKIVPAVKTERRFCSQACANSWKSEAYAGENNPQWTGGREPYYGSNWPKKRFQAIVRDQARCRDCGATEADSMVIFGEGLSVHHIKPLKEHRESDGIDFESANRLENLLTLCRSCHMSREKSG